MFSRTTVAVGFTASRGNFKIVGTSQEFGENLLMDEMVKFIGAAKIHNRQPQPIGDGARQIRFGGKLGQLYYELLSEL